jgi:hypothetical protein
MQIFNVRGQADEAALSAANNLNHGNLGLNGLLLFQRE